MKNKSKILRSRPAPGIIIMSGLIYRKQIELRPVVLREFNFSLSVGAFVSNTLNSVTLNFRHGISFFIWCHEVYYSFIFFSFWQWKLVSLEMPLNTKYQPLKAKTCSILSLIVFNHLLSMFNVKTSINFF